jgi:hypothetical protein
VAPLYLQKLALTSPTSGGRSVGVVHSRTQATGFSLVFLSLYLPHSITSPSPHIKTLSSSLPNALPSSLNNLTISTYEYQHLTFFISHRFTSFISHRFTFFISQRFNFFPTYIFRKNKRALPGSLQAGEFLPFLTVTCCVSLSSPSSLSLSLSLSLSNGLINFEELKTVMEAVQSGNIAGAR